MTSRHSLPRRDVVSAMLYTADGQVLLQLRDDKPTIPYPGHWTLFGGQVESGETPDQAIRRELLEELELDLPLTQWKQFPCPVRSIPGELVVIHTSYMGHLTRPVGSLTLHEGQAMQLFAAHEVGALHVAFAQLDVLNEFFALHLPASKGRTR